MGLLRLDAKKVKHLDIEVEVTQKDIQNGRKTDCHSCPIALALNKAFPRAHYIAVTHSCLDITVQDENGYFTYYDYDVPDIASDFISKFDAGQPVEPFKFVSKCISLNFKQPVDMSNLWGD